MTDTFPFTTSGILSLHVIVLQIILSLLDCMFLGGNLTARFFPGGFGDVLVWEETALHYSANKGGEHICCLFVSELANPQDKQLYHCLFTMHLRPCFPLCHWR